MTFPRTLLPAARGALAVALLICAGAMWSLLPTKLQSWAPIDIHGTVGQRVVGRNIAFTVKRAYLAREVSANSRDGLNRFPSKGVWLVMMVSYEPTLTPEKPRFDLIAGGDTFDTNLSALQHLVQPGMPSSGPMAFELPRIPQSATLLVSNAVTESSMAKMDYAPLDSRIAIDIPLSGVAPTATLNLDELAAK